MAGNDFKRESDLSPRPPGLSLLPDQMDGCLGQGWEKTGQLWREGLAESTGSALVRWRSWGSRTLNVFPVSNAGTGRAASESSRGGEHVNSVVQRR